MLTKLSWRLAVLCDESSPVLNGNGCLLSLSFSYLFVRPRLAFYSSARPHPSFFLISSSFTVHTVILTRSSFSHFPQRNGLKTLQKQKGEPPWSRRVVGLISIPLGWGRSRKGYRRTKGTTFAVNSLLLYRVDCKLPRTSIFNAIMEYECKGKLSRFKIHNHEQ